MPLLILLVQILHHHELLELRLDAFSTFDQGSSGYLAIGAHLFTRQDQVLVLLGYIPDPCQSANRSDFHSQPLNLLVVHHFGEFLL